MSAKLVAIGDSLTEGYLNGSISKTQLSYPALIAGCLEDENTDFYRPDSLSAGEPPLSLESLLNSLDAEQQPDLELYRTVRRTLDRSQAPQYPLQTQIDAAQKIADTEGIDNLIFWLGTNHCLQTVVNLKMEWSTEETLSQPLHLQAANLWRPEHFKSGLHQVTAQVAALSAKNVFIANIPHVTIAPVSRGVTPGAAPNVGQDADGYFEYYTHFWILDSEFDLAIHPHLTRSQVKEIDTVIDEYNLLIQAEADRHGWHLVNTASALDDLAFRRQQGKSRYTFPPELIAALRANPKTKDRVTTDGKILLDTRYFQLEPAAQPSEASHQEASHQGGLFSLDATHPTTLGYGIIAREFLQIMQKVWDAQGQQSPVKPLDWEKIIASDTLLTEPPANLAELRKIMALLFSQSAAPVLASTRQKPGKRGPEDQSGSSGGRKKR